MLPSGGGSLFLLKSFALRMCVRRFISGVMCLVFIMITTHLILMDPVLRNPRARFNLRQFHHSKKRSFLDQDLNSGYNITHCDKFVIFDADSYSGKLSFLESRPNDWCAFVVNLNDSLQLSTCSNCMVVKDEWVFSHVVKLIANKFVKHGHSILSSSQLSKMAAYLYVLLQKPNWIFVTDRTSSIPYKSFEKVTGKEVKTGPVYQGPNEIFEPCSHFVDPVTWRGRDDNQVQGRYNIKVVSSHSVYHVMDSCHKPGMNPRALKESFDTEAPTPYLMPGTYGAIDFNNVLVSAKNAWTLVASLVVQSGLKLSNDKEKDQKVKNNTISHNMINKSNIKNNINSNNSNTSNNDNNNGNTRTSVGKQLTHFARINLMVQRLLWESEVTVGFIPGDQNAIFINEESRSCDVFSQMNNTEKSYYAALEDWACDSFQDIRNCLVHLASNTTVSNGELEYLTHVWAFLLKEYDIEAIHRVPFSKEKFNEKMKGIPLYFTPIGLVKNDTMRSNPFRDMCRSHGRPYHSVIPEQYPVPKILLIIVFNFPFLVSHIPLLDYVYGRHFKHIVYCSESTAEFEQRYQRIHPDKPVTWIEIKHYMGYWGQNCMSAAIKIGYDVRGYLQISDDVIMNVWNFDKVPYNQPWFQSNMRVAHIDRDVVPDVWTNNYWWPWTQFSGKKSAMAAYNHLEAMLSNPSNSDRISAFMENIYNITNCDRCFLYEASDIFYLPSELGANFTFFADIFSYNKVFLEITIPTVLAGITSDKAVYRLRGNYLWFHDRDRYPFVYTEFDHFYHAWKLSRFGNGREVQFFCRQFLSRIDKHLMLRPVRGGT